MCCFFVWHLTYTFFLSLIYYIRVVGLHSNQLSLVYLIKSFFPSFFIVLDDYDVNGGGGGVAAAASDDAIFNNNNNNNNRLGGINSDNTDGGGGFGGFWHSESIPNTHLGIWDSSPYIESVLSMADETKRKRKRSVVDLDSTK